MHSAEKHDRHREFPTRRVGRGRQLRRAHLSSGFARHLRICLPCPGTGRCPNGWSLTLRSAISVGPSRHLVKFVEADDHLWALKELPTRLASEEY
jgi:hypothetical protein